MSGVRFVGDLGAQLESFAEEIEEVALRHGGGAAVEVLYNEMRVGASAPVERTGNLRNSIYRYLDKNASTPTRLVYYVGPNKRKAPHWHLIEFGHWMYYETKVINGKFITFRNRPLPQPRWVPATPFIRPTFHAKIKQALEAGKRRIGESIKGIQNGK